MEFSGRYEYLAEISEFVEQSAREAGLNDSAVYAVQLAVDEACSNIIEHAYGGESQGKIQITCEGQGGLLRVILRDRGRPFNPEKIPTPNTNTPLNKVKPRGAGLFLIRKLMDEVNFDFSNKNENVLTLVKKNRG